MVSSPEHYHMPPARLGPDHLAYGRIIRHLPEAKIIVGPDHPAYGRIIRPWELSSNSKPKLFGDGRIIRPYFGSSDQHRPLVFAKYVENCRKMEKKMQNQFC